MFTFQHLLITAGSSSLITLLLLFIGSLFKQRKPLIINKGVKQVGSDEEWEEAFEDDV